VSLVAAREDAGIVFAADRKSSEMGNVRVNL